MGPGSSSPAGVVVLVVVLAVVAVVVVITPCGVVVTVGMGDSPLDAVEAWATMKKRAALATMPPARTTQKTMMVVTSLRPRRARLMKPSCFSEAEVCSSPVYGWGARMKIE